MTRCCVRVHFQRMQTEALLWPAILGAAGGHANGAAQRGQPVDTSHTSGWQHAEVSGFCMTGTFAYHRCNHTQPFCRSQWASKQKGLKWKYWCSTLRCSSNTACQSTTLIVEKEKVTIVNLQHKTWSSSAIATAQKLSWGAVFCHPAGG